MEQQKLFNDEIDISSIFSVLLDNFNILASILVSSIFVTLIIYLSSTNLYQSDSLIEITGENSSLVPTSLSEGINFGKGNTKMEAEIAIYKSENTIDDALKTFYKSNFANDFDLDLSSGKIRSNLILDTNLQSLINISFISENKKFSSIFLNILNEEFIKDRKEFIRQSSRAGRNFINQEIPRIKILLKEAEDNLNDFKVSTNTTDYIFNSSNRNTKLEDLKNRINELTFKELELKEFYKENHPIYQTLSEQKNLILSQINEIEIDLPNIPSTQEPLKIFKEKLKYIPMF